MKKIRIALAGLLARTVSAFDNSTMTEAYQKIIYGDNWEAWQIPYRIALGDWFHGGLLFVPALSLFIHQRSLNVSAIWLLCALVAYGAEVQELPGWIFYFFIVAWVAVGLIKLLAIKYHN